MMRKYTATPTAAPTASPGAMPGLQTCSASRAACSAASSSSLLNSSRHPGQLSMNQWLMSMMLMNQMVGIMGNCWGWEKPFWVPSTRCEYR